MARTFERVNFLVLIEILLGFLVHQGVLIVAPQISHTRTTRGGEKLIE